MFFTQEDYRKIEEYLRLNSYKDTDLPPLEREEIDVDNDIMTIVHNGKNYKISLQKLIAAYEWEKQDSIDSIEVIEGCGSRWSNDVPPVTEYFYSVTFDQLHEIISSNKFVFLDFEDQQNNSPNILIQVRNFGNTIIGLDMSPLWVGEDGTKLLTLTRGQNGEIITQVTDESISTVSTVIITPNEDIDIEEVTNVIKNGGNIILQENDGFKLALAEYDLNASGKVDLMKFYSHYIDPQGGVDTVEGYIWSKDNSGQHWEFSETGLASTNSFALPDDYETGQGTPLQPGDSYNESFAKLEGMIEKNELVTAAAFIDLNSKIGSTKISQNYSSPLDTGGIAPGDTYEQAFRKLEEQINSMKDHSDDGGGDTPEPAALIYYGTSSTALSTGAQIQGLHGSTSTTVEDIYNGAYYYIAVHSSKQLKSIINRGVEPVTANFILKNSSLTIASNTYKLYECNINAGAETWDMDTYELTITIE